MYSVLIDDIIQADTVVTEILQSNPHKGDDLTVRHLHLAHLFDCYIQHPHNFTGNLFLNPVPKIITKTGIGISPTVMNPSTEDPQPSPSDPKSDGPASGRNAATMLRSTVKAASPEAA